MISAIGLIFAECLHVEFSKLRLLWGLASHVGTDLCVLALEVCMSIESFLEEVSLCCIALFMISPCWRKAWTVCICWLQCLVFGIVPDDFCNWLNLCWMFACRIQQTETFYEELHHMWGRIYVCLRLKSVCLLNLSGRRCPCVVLHCLWFLLAGGRLELYAFVGCSA